MFIFFYEKQNKNKKKKKNSKAALKTVIRCKSKKKNFFSQIFLGKFLYTIYS